ncbi:MAG: hypothetical protein D6782_07735 [Alphaproteobacteria bacterium]|nr:MAG: hypothetical protein D6782_07735 [Alphaproteobacteria bacterium]
MSLGWTIVIIALSAATVAATVYLERRGYGRARFRLVPLAPIQFLALLVLLAMIGHLVSLATGKPFIGRAGF